LGGGGGPTPQLGFLALRCGVGPPPPQPPGNRSLAERDEHFLYNGPDSPLATGNVRQRESLMFTLMSCLLFAAGPVEDWKQQESARLKNIRQVTKGFARAGEGYFSPDMKEIIFQAEEKDTGNPFYQIFIQDLATGKVRRVSPGVGKTTCAYFHPKGKKIIFASTHLDPDAKKHYQSEYEEREREKKEKKRRRYVWD